MTFTHVDTDGVEPGRITDPLVRAERLADYADQCRAIIARTGWMVQGVFAVDDTDVDFGYTVGLTPLELPELCMTGVPADVYQSVLNEFAYDAYHHGRRWAHGETVEMASDGYLFMVVDGPGSKDTVWPGTARMLYGADAVRLQQVVWQSQEHRWPWDDGYDGPEQPVIGRPS